MKDSNTSVVIYARVSTSTQDYNHQLKTLREFAKKNSYIVLKEFKEKISGAKKVEDRQALCELMDFVKENKVDKILVFECSRLSRRPADFLNIIEELNELGVSLHIIQNGLETLLPDGSVNPIAQLVVGIIGQFNAMERSLIRSRMKAGFDAYRANGGIVGRKEGYVKPDLDYKHQYCKEIYLLEKGNTLKDIKTITGTSINTIRKLKRMFAL